MQPLFDAGDVHRAVGACKYAREELLGLRREGERPGLLVGEARRDALRRMHRDAAASGSSGLTGEAMLEAQVLHSTALMNSRRANAAKMKRKRASSSPRGAIRKLFGGRLFTYKLGKRDKAGTVLSFEQTGGCEYTITAADIKNKKVRRATFHLLISCLTLFSSPPPRASLPSPQSIDGALKLNMKWRSAAVKAALQVLLPLSSSLFVLHTLTGALLVCPLPTRTWPLIAAAWARSR